MTRSLRLWPPPRCQIVWSPLLRRPPLRCFGSVSGLYGFVVVKSSFTIVVVKRRVGVTGLYVLIARIFALGELSAFASAIGFSHSTSVSLFVVFFFRLMTFD